MLKNTRLLILGVLVVVGLAIFLLLRPRLASDAVVFGVVFPLTGDAAPYGEKGQQAIELAVSTVSRDGGCGGREVRVVFEDSRADPTVGVSAFRKLVDADKAQVVIGDIVSAVTLAVAPIAESNDVLLLSPTSSAPAITQAGEYIYRIWPSDLAEGRAIAELALRRGLKRVSILHMTNDYGSAIARIFRGTLEAGGGEVVTSDGYQPDNTDFRTPLLRVQRGGPDALYIAGYFADTAAIVRQARELALEVQLLGTTAVEDDQLLQLAGDAAEGLIYPLATGFDVHSDSPQVRSFVEAFRAQFGHDPGWVEAAAYDSFMLLCTAAGTLDGPVSGLGMRRALDSMEPYEGVGGTIRFDENGDVLKPVVFRMVREGQFTPLGQTP